MINTHLVKRCKIVPLFFFLFPFFVLLFAINSLARETSNKICSAQQKISPSLCAKYSMENIKEVRRMPPWNAKNKSCEPSINALKTRSIRRTLTISFQNNVHSQQGFFWVFGKLQKTIFNKVTNRHHSHTIHFHMNIKAKIVV